MGHQPGSVAVIHRVWTLWKNEALLKGHNLLYIIAALLALMFASTTFFFWYHEMFRDGFIGEFSRAFDSGRGKNFVALTQPAFGALSICSSIIFISEAITSDPSHQIARTNSPWYLWKLLLATICLLLLLVLVLSIIPFTLPEWMYPEYHAAKREEQRKQETAENGEAEDRNPFLGDDGVYASQLGNVPIDIPEAVGLPSTGDPPAPPGPARNGRASTLRLRHRRCLRHHSHYHCIAPHRGAHQPRRPARPRSPRLAGGQHLHSETKHSETD